jgi:cytoskeletal protein CcmA (bactofilin family)
MISRLSFLAGLSVCALSLALTSRAALAEASHDRTQVGRNILIGTNEQVSEATCFGCSIRVKGHVAGDVTAFGGTIVVEDQGQIGGDTTSFGGDIRLENQVKVEGDVTVFGGHVRRAPGAVIGGDVTNMSGGGWILLIFVAPFLVFGLFVWFVVWVVRRLTQPAVPAAV